MGRAIISGKPRKKPAAGGVNKPKPKAKAKASPAALPVTPAGKAANDKKKEAKPAGEAPDSDKKAKASEEIDGLFGQLKGAKKAKKADKEGGEQKKGGAGDGGKPKKLEGSKDDIFGTETGKGRKRTEEGFVIYSEEELGMGKKGGETDQCPFDCDCCF